MKRKWFVIPSVLVLIAVGALAAPRLWPRPKVMVDRAMRQQTIDTLVAKLNAHYVFPDKARQIEAALRQRQRDGQYDAIADGEQLAKRLSDDIDGVVHDQHLAVEFEPGQVPPDLVGPPPRTLAEWEREAPLPVRLFRHVSALGVDKVDRLPHNIGYLKITGFPPSFLVAEKYATAMNELADTDGLIVDLREHGGGGSDTVALLVSYFVDGRTRLNDIWERHTGVTRQQWTVEKLDGKRYGGRKPVVILAGPGTMSAGEEFVYTMQAMKRATVIGERTWGGAHPARPYRLGDHFYAVIPDAHPLNPITHANWEGTGVLPDISAKPDRALDVAKELLQRRQGSAALASAGR